MRNKFSKARIPMVLVLALFVAISLVTTAAAQEEVPGVFHARDIPGWQYHRPMSMIFGASVWYPRRQGNPPDGANCNIVTIPLAGTQEEYVRAYRQTTIESYTRTMARLNPQSTGVLRVRYFEYGGRAPGLMAAATSISEGFDMKHMSMEIAGPNRVVTITCTARQEFFAGRSQDFTDFLSAVRLVTD